MDAHRAGRLSRRELIAGAAAVGAGALAATQAARADTPPPDDATLLTTALQYERLTVLAYDHLVALPGLSAHERHILRGLARQDRAHARALESEMTARSLALPAPPSGPADVDAALSAKHMKASVVRATDLKGAVLALLDIEALAQGAYYLLIRDAREPALALRATQALSTEAQHSTLLTQLVSTDIMQSVPTWYVTGVT
jgi:hypothetical protein